MQPSARPRPGSWRRSAKTFATPSTTPFPRTGPPAAGPAQALLQRIAQIPQVFTAAIPLVNSVLSLKSRRAQELGIHMEIQVGHMDTGQLQNMELCSLLGNLLDNAIDACVPLVPSGEPVILVNLRTQGRLLAPGRGKPGGPAATGQHSRGVPHHQSKPGAPRLGLQSARRIARRNHGCLLTELGEGTFRTIVMLNTGFLPN